MTDPQREDWSKLIAVAHSAGLSNESIGSLLPQYGAQEARTETTVRRWAMRKGEPRHSDGEALKRLVSAIIAENVDTSSAEVIPTA